MPNHRIGYIFADRELIRVYDEVSIPFPFSDLSANIFMNVINDYKNIKQTKENVIEANKKIYAILDEKEYLYTSIETPIFTLKSNKDVDLMHVLLANNIIAESGENFMNLDKRFARIRINRDIEKMIDILSKI